MPFLCTEGMRSICRGLLPLEGPACCCPGLCAWALPPAHAPGRASAVLWPAGATGTPQPEQQMGSGSSLVCALWNLGANVSHPYCYYVFYCNGSQLLWIRDLLHFISRNRNIISVPESCVSRKEIAYRYRGDVTVTHFNLLSTTFGKRKPQEKTKLLHQCFLGACSRAKGTH